MDSAIIRLIKEYITCSKYMCSLFQPHYQNLDKEGFWSSYRLKLIPKEGYMGNVYFSFHGGGCYFETENDKIDVDFGPHTRCDGFDLMRLNHFLESRKTNYSEFNEQEALEHAFNKLIKENIIVKPKWIPGPHLYYLQEAVS